MHRDSISCTGLSSSRVTSTVCCSTGSFCVCSTTDPIAGKSSGFVDIIGCVVKRVVYWKDSGQDAVSEKRSEGNAGVYVRRENLGGSRDLSLREVSRAAVAESRSFWESDAIGAITSRVACYRVRIHLLAVCFAFLPRTSRVHRVARPQRIAHLLPCSFTTMFPSSSSFTSSSNTGTGQEQRPQFPHSHSHSHSVQYNGSPFSVAGMTNQTAASPSIRGGSLGMSMSSSLGMGSPLSESLSQSRSHYQSGYLMVRMPCVFFNSLLSNSS